MTDQIDLEPNDRLPIGGSALQGRLAAAAIELFSSQGAPATTVREITAACGLSPGALYNHFTSKDQLLYVLVRDIHLQFDARMAAVVASAGPDPAAQLAAWVRLLVARAAGHNKQSRVANREFTALTGSRQQEVIILRRKIRDRLTGIVLAGSQAGTFVLPGGDDLGAATLTSATIGTMCVHISRWTLEHHPLTLPQLQDRYVEMALRIAGKKA